MSPEQVQCPLCRGESIEFYDRFRSCKSCEGVFVPETLHVSREAEKARYEHHQNDAGNEGYVNYLKPVLDYVQSNFSTSSQGIDFGSGPSPVLAELLREKGCSIALYDPYFAPSTEVLDAQYDFVVCTEVIEHFREPANEFNLLKRILKPGGSLICMTQLLQPHINFEQWFYKNDMTHVFIYKARTMEVVKRQFQFSDVRIIDRVIVFRN